MNELRDSIVLYAAAILLALATPRTRARIRIALIRTAHEDAWIPQSLLDRAQLTRRPGE